MRHVHGDDGLFWVDHDGVAAETDRAKCFRIAGGDVWLPKSQIKDENDESVAVPLWFAEEKELEISW